MSDSAAVVGKPEGSPATPQPHSGERPLMIGERTTFDGQCGRMSTLPFGSQRDVSPVRLVALRLLNRKCSAQDRAIWLGVFKKNPNAGP
jgi:hypothetical protein